MTTSERTLLFYVLDLIKLSPKKYADLLRHLNTEEELRTHSTEYAVHIEWLSSATNPEEAVVIADAIRKQIL